MLFDADLLTSEPEVGAAPVGYIRVLLVGDHQMMAESLVQGLRAFERLEVLGHCSDLSDTLRLLEVRDVVLIDAQNEAESSMSTSLAIRKKNANLKIMFLSLSENAGSIRDALLTGGHGYLSRRSDMQELRDAILTVASGYKYFSKRIVNALLRSPLPDGNRNSPAWIEGLSVRELEVAELIAQGHTTDEIADKIYLSVNTVEAYRCKLIRKLGVRNSAGLGAWAAKNGLI